MIKIQALQILCEASEHAGAVHTLKVVCECTCVCAQICTYEIIYVYSANLSHCYKIYSTCFLFTLLHFCILIHRTFK